jgi:peptidoglycan/LPS O-acetylase OafA/YrhL
VLAFTLVLRFAWLALYLGLSRRFGTEVWYDTGALAGWFTWCAGALAAEAACGTLKLPRWISDPRCAAALVLLAMVTSGLDRIFQERWIYAASHAALAYLPSFPVQPLWGLAGLSVVLAAVRSEWCGTLRGPCWRGLSRLGTISYSLYLTHSLFVIELAAAVTTHFHLADRLGCHLALVPLALLFAWGFYHLFERPFLPPPRPVAS